MEGHQSPNLQTFKEPRNLFQGIDSPAYVAWGRIERQPYLMYRPARLHRLAGSIPLLFKGLKIRAQRVVAILHIEIWPLPSLRDFGDVGVLFTYN